MDLRGVPYLIPEALLHAVRGALLGVRHALRVPALIILNLAHGERVGLEQL